MIPSNLPKAHEDVTAADLSSDFSGFVDDSDAETASSSDGELSEALDTEKVYCSTAQWQ